jgi:hypothetical protein
MRCLTRKHAGCLVAILLGSLVLALLTRPW